MIKKTGAWVEVDLNNIENNLNNIKKALHPNKKVCCVLKADAYGHGAVEVAKFLEEKRVDFFSVARVEEALELANNGINTPILCMGYIDESMLKDAILNNIRLTVYSVDMAKTINNIALKLNKKAFIHIKIDTGMSRLGFIADNEGVELEIKTISKLSNIAIEGIYTHFATADSEDKTFFEKQLKRFKKVVNKLDVFIPIVHVANSATIIDYKDLEFNMVRCGIALYGYYPSDEVKKDVKLSPALMFKTKVTNIKEIKKGEGVGYGLTYMADKNVKIATLSVGYADGYSRAMKEPKVILNGELVDIAGRICMDQCMVLVPDTLNVNIGDEVVLIGDREEVSAETIASKLGTINYEVICDISRRVTKVYTYNKKEIKSKNYLID